jgi:hypothetical protein
MTLHINTYEDLIQFLERDNIDIEIMQRVAHKFLRTVPLSFSDLTKEQFRKQVKGYIERFADCEDKPLFLEQRQKEFNIRDIYRS